MEAEEKKKKGRTRGNGPKGGGPRGQGGFARPSVRGGGLLALLPILKEVLESEIEKQERERMERNMKISRENLGPPAV